MERKEIVKAVRELNKVLGLEPKINVKLSTEELIELLVKAADLIEPEDVISEATEEVLEKLQENENDEEEQEEEQAVEEIEEEEPETEIEEPEEEEVEEKPAKKEAKKKAGKKEPKASKEKERTETRISVVTKIIKENEKINKRELIEEANKRYSGKPNKKETNAAINKAIQCLIAYGLISYKNEVISKQ